MAFLMHSDSLTSSLDMLGRVLGRFDGGLGGLGERYCSSRKNDMLQLVLAMLGMLSLMQKSALITSSSPLSVIYGNDRQSKGFLFLHIDLDNSLLNEDL